MLSDRMNRLTYANNKYLGTLIDTFKDGFFEQWLFIIVFYDRVFRYIILGLFIEQTEVIDHYYYAIEKNSFIVILAFVGIKALYLLFHDRKALFKPGTVFIAGFCGVVLLSTFINDPNFMYDYMKKLSVCELLMVALFMYNIPRFMTEKRFETTVLWCGRLICYTVLVLAVISLYIYFTGNSVSLFGTVFEKANLYSGGHAGSSDARYYGLFTYPTTLGFRCYLASVLSCHLYKKNKMSIIIPILIVPMSFILIYIADSRTAFINMLVILCFIAAQIMQKHSISAKKAYGSIAVLVTAGIIAVLYIKRDIIADILADPMGALNRLSSNRVALFVDRWNIFKAHPWIGAGWDVEPFSSSISANNAHNILANILAWTGIAGLISFTLFAVTTVISITKNKERVMANQYLVCLIICVFIHSLLDQAIIGHMRNPATYMFWISFAFLAYGTLGENDTTVK